MTGVQTCALPIWINTSLSSSARRINSPNKRSTCPSVSNTCMGMLDVCPDQKLCGRIIEYLAPIQLGEKEAGEILAVERNVADEYFAMEDEEVTMAECQML